MVTLFNHQGTLIYTDVLGVSRLGAVYDGVEKGVRPRPQAECGTRSGTPVK